MLNLMVSDPKYTFLFNLLENEHVAWKAPLYHYVSDKPLNMHKIIKRFKQLKWQIKYVESTERGCSSILVSKEDGSYVYIGNKFEVFSNDRKILNWIKHQKKINPNDVYMMLLIFVILSNS